MVQRRHKYVGWRRVSGWKCIRCGRCCRDFLIDLAPGEAVYYTLKYGPVVFSYKGKYYLLMKPDGSCLFLRYKDGHASCAIYHDRPRVCRIYPFYVRRKPLDEARGEEEDAAYNYNGNKLYVYIDSACPGVNREQNISTLVKSALMLWIRLFR